MYFIINLDQPLYDQLGFLRQASFRNFYTKDNEMAASSTVEPSLRLSIHEANGQLVTRLEATDPDEGINGEVEYGLRWDSNSPRRRDFLATDKGTGEVRLVRPLQNNDLGVHAFIVSASDKGQPSTRSESKVQYTYISYY